jgi:hypothetical protein
MAFFGGSITKENKVNEIIYADNDITVNSFKCSVHPLLQFGTVAQKKVGEIETNRKIYLLYPVLGRWKLHNRF